MSVQVIDVQTGKLKSMSAKYAQILVKMKRARWPEAINPEAVAAVPVADAPVVEVAAEAAPTLADASKKRSCKPKAQE